MTRPRSDIVYCMPRPWYNEPINEAVKEDLLMDGYIDENGNITSKGKEEIHLVQERLLGTETREHYEEYLKHWDPFFEEWMKWATDERIPWEDQPEFDYKETWDSEK